MKSARQQVVSLANNEGTAALYKFASVWFFELTESLCLGLAPDLPEDLYMLIKKAVAVRKHLSVNRKDRDSKLYVLPPLRLYSRRIGLTFCSRLILIESRIHRLSRYYKVRTPLGRCDIWRLTF